jgi:hypothetical protein
MSYSVVYWNRATEDVYDVIRGQLPRDWTLITLAGETKAEWHAQIRDADFMISTRRPSCGWCSTRGWATSGSTRRR